MNNDTSFWLGVAVAIPLSVVGSIVGNRLTRNVDAFLEKRKLIKSNRSKEQEIANYKRVASFKNGTSDKYPYYILLSTAAVISAVGSATCLVLLALQNWNVFGFLNPAVFLLAFLLGAFAAVFTLAIAETARHIEQFDQYQAEIRKKWGEDVI